ncbi:SulP family inorganic anion transporter [Porphyromonas circumdentaria]|uniref:SulP family inorganic anion transporter n=1 Tax=Porphyromonas circumdentaria TaxID=29524 RepID=UPI0026DB1025|nr:sulfate permease [Porphyromonas circumdentaria]MDO4721847.1 sulfate permease [Porphyromonas circumdentaria]
MMLSERASALWGHFTPQLFKSLRDYNREKFAKDVMAGLIVGIVALPLAIAFGIASGVSPEKGLITAIIGGFIVSFFGGSSVQIGGPTGAFIVIVYGIIQQFGIEGLAIATFMAGLILLLLGFLRLGTVIRFIPYPIIIGFTSGIAVTIFTTQIKDFFGLTTEPLPGDFLGKWAVYLHSFGTVQWTATAIGVLTIAIIFLFPKISKRIPGSLIAIIVMTLLVYVLHEFTSLTGMETIGDRFSFSASLPQAESIGLSMEKIRQLLPSAFTIAMLGAIESLLSASVADGAINEKHNSNMELIAQGTANIVVPFFGGIPVTGAIARTMTNIKNGGKTPIAGIVHTIVLLLIMLFLGQLTAFIPMACLAGILMVVSFNMSEIKSFTAILKGPLGDRAVLLVTFLLTVLIDLTIAIEIGMLLSVLLFMRRTYRATDVILHKNHIDLDNETDPSVQEEQLKVPEGVEVFEINGPFFFGIANRFEEVTKLVGKRPQIRILRMRRVPFMDATGAHNLKMMVNACQKENITLILSGVNDTVHETLSQVGIATLLGEENICPNIHRAIHRAQSLLQEVSTPVEA